MYSRTFFFVFISLVFIVHSGVSQQYAQKKSNIVDGPKYLPKNEAEGFLEFEVKQLGKKVELKWTSDENLAEKKIHILKGKIDKNKQISWEILAALETERGQKRKFTYIDALEKQKVYYRLMVSDVYEVIQYTSIVTFKPDMI